VSRPPSQELFPQDLFPQELLSALVHRIDTGTDSLDMSRALVVFNLTPQSQSGVAVFRASMSWPRDVPLPPVVITDSDVRPVPSAIRDMTQGLDAKGRADRVQLGFAIYFMVTDVPTNGWRTYIATYTDAPSPELENAPPNADLIVMETTRHSGDLPVTGELPLPPR
jgi:hypothetical protein